MRTFAPKAKTASPPTSSPAPTRERIAASTREPSEAEPRSRRAPSVGFADVPLRAPSPPPRPSPAPVRRPLVVASAAEPLGEERALDEEADRLAEHAFALPHAREEPPPVTRRAPTATAAPSPTVRAALDAPSVALDDPLRRTLEASLGVPLDRVRVHADDRADRAARSLGAFAFALRDDLVFRRGHYAPHTAIGRQLIAHEVVHLLQAPGGAQPLLKKAPQQAGGVSFWFSVRVTTKLDADGLLIEFIKQYRHVASDAEAQKLRADEKWQHTGDQVVTDADLKRGYTLVHVTDRSLKPPTDAEKKADADDLQTMAASERSELNDEADAEFWANTHYKVGEQLGKSKTDREMSQYWLTLRDALLRERREIESLPANLKKFLFTDGAPRIVAPKDYATVLRIAHKLSQLSQDELDDYKSKVNADTTQWAALEQSVDDYLAERQTRLAERDKREALRTRLFGLEELYKKWKEWKGTASAATSLPASDEFGVRDPVKGQMQAMAESQREELDRELPRYGFDSISAFEKAIADYEASFIRECQQVAFDLLAKYEHVLFEAEKKFRDPSYAAGLQQALSKTQAKQLYKESGEAKSAAAGIMPDPEIHRFLPGEFELKQKLEQESAQKHSQAEGQVAAAVGDAPLVGNRDFDREALAGAGSGAELQKQVLQYIADRRADIGKSRYNITDDPEVVFKLDELLKAVYQADAIRSGSIYDLIVQDRIHEIHISEAIKNFLLGVLAVAITIATAGTGTVAVLGALTVFGISAYQAVETYHEYEVKSAAHGAQLLSEKPSFTWVIVALVGAGIDLAAVGSTLKTIQPAIETFNKAHDVEQLAKDLKGVDEALKANILKAARAEAQYQEAVQGLLGGAGKLRAVLVPGSEEFGRLVVVAYYLAKRGVVAFERFLLELKAQKLIADIDKLSAEELAGLKQAFAEGVAKSKTGLFEYATLSEQARAAYTAEEVETLAARGRALGLNDGEIRDFLEVGGIAKPGKVPPKVPLTADQLAEQMDNWVKVVKARGYPYLFESAESFTKFKDEARALAKRFGLPDGELAVQGSALRSPGAKDIDVALFVSDAEFDRYVEQCIQGIESRAGKPAAGRVVKQLKGYANDGQLPMFYFDRIGADTFATEARELLGDAFGIKGVDFSIMKRSSSVAMKPELAF